MPLKTTKWDAADHLDTPEAAAAYLRVAFEGGDPHLVAAAIGDVARAKGMSKLAREIGMSRESLYRARSPKGNPELTTTIKVLKALGLRLEAKPAEPEAA